jgi:hypothetical protein
MGGLATWSSRRVRVLWLAWVGLLSCLVVLNVWRQWRDRAPPAVSEVPDSIVGSVLRVPTDSAPVATVENKRLKVLPERTRTLFTV